MNRKNKTIVGLLIVGVLAIGAIFASSAIHPSGNIQANRGGGSQSIL
ncbi:TPA: hypothetical protein ACF2DD_002089 [Clostridium perfringens]|uniref:Uncharacterized protein n=1 Tax=Veillonella parvula TaxID=29466 RepID=A0A942WS37_VEIPA|nr:MULTISPECIES: hypothetical protein [Bacillota]MBS4893793.1 hypothetical protein [Veillonella parvula]MDM0587729.1 hypothetical protein [Clostridium perfringens]